MPRGTRIIPRFCSDSPIFVIAVNGIRKYCGITADITIIAPDYQSMHEHVDYCLNIFAWSCANKTKYISEFPSRFISARDHSKYVVWDHALIHAFDRRAARCTVKDERIKLFYEYNHACARYPNNLPVVSSTSHALLIS